MHGFHELEKCVIYLCRCGVGWSDCFVCFFIAAFTPISQTLSGDAGADGGHG